MSHRDLKFVSVFYEAQHNDARTNIAIALSAAEHGATIANYVEASAMTFDGKKVTGVKAVDNMSGEEFEIKAKKVILAGGPYTDLMRKMEDDKAKPAVQGASGSHVVLPGYYCPNDMGLLDYNTSDGRFLFFLPWQGHTLVGTTDKKVSALQRRAKRDEHYCAGRVLPLAFSVVVYCRCRCRCSIFVASADTRTFLTAKYLATISSALPRLALPLPRTRCSGS